MMSVPCQSGEERILFQLRNEWLRKEVTYRSNQSISYVIFYCMVKGKAILLQALAGSEGSRSLRLPDFKTIGT
jgi:hypothetical protein